LAVSSRCGVSGSRARDQENTLAVDHRYRFLGRFRRATERGLPCRPPPPAMRGDVDVCAGSCFFDDDALGSGEPNVFAVAIAQTKAAILSLPKDAAMATSTTLAGFPVLMNPLCRRIAAPGPSRRCP
jgi:hypothetical protein